MAANLADWKRAAAGLLAIALAGVGAFACSATPPEPNAEGGTLNGSSAEDVDPVQLRKNRGGGGGGGGY
jgi:hypothetical protein